MVGGSLKKEDYQISSNQGAIGPDYSPAQAQHNKDNPDNEIKEGGLLQRSVCSSGDYGQTTKAIELKAKEGSKDVQTIGGGNFLIKHPLFPHLMHYTNSYCCINGKMISKQCPHSLHLTLPPPAKQRWDKYPRKNQRPSKWKVRMHS